MSRSEILDYEIRASWWAPSVSHPWLQELTGRYFAWKVKRKYGRWMLSRIEKAALARS